MRRAARASQNGLLVRRSQSSHRSESNQSPPQDARASIASTQSHKSQNGSFRVWLWGPASAAGAAALGTSLVWQEELTLRAPAAGRPVQPGTCLHTGWVQEIALAQDTEMVLSATTMHRHPLLKKDHLFSELHKTGMVEDLVCFYCPPERRLDYVVQLGKIVHGGLTAAIIDESFGFLWLSVRAAKQLPFSGPAFTAHLEVDYKQKIPAGKLLLCKTEVETCAERKLWMKAVVCDGDSGKVYATARALFVCPRIRRLVSEGMRYAINCIFS